MANGRNTRHEATIARGIQRQRDYGAALRGARLVAAVIGTGTLLFLFWLLTIHTHPDQTWVLWVVLGVPVCLAIALYELFAHRIRRNTGM